MTPRPLEAELLFADARVGEAVSLLRSALVAHQDELKGVRPPDPDRAPAYAEELERFGAFRGGELFYPYLGSGLGSGALVELADGSVKYDLIGGIGVHYFGHGHPDLAEKLLEASFGDTVMQGNLQQNRESSALVEALLDLATRQGAPLAHCFLTTSGAMANENALKLVCHHHHPADRLLAFDGCFAGRTLGMAQVTDNPNYRDGLPTALAVDYVPFFDPADAAGSTERACAALDAHLARYPGRHAAMILELVQGEGGYYAGDRAFFEALVRRLRDAEVAIWFDEIQTFGRTSEPFAFQHFGLDAHADVVTVGKSLQVCATLFRGEYRPPPGLVSQTFTGSTSAIVAGRFVVERFAAGDLFGPGGRVMELAAQFAAGFEAIRSRHPAWIAPSYGLGAMVACTPFAGRAGTTKQLLGALFERGVIAFATGGRLARLRFLPPVPVLRDRDVDTVLEILEESLAAVAPEAASAAGPSR